MAEEKLFENKVKSFLKQEGAWVLKTWGGGYQRAGIPDLLICHKGHFIGVELKAPKGKTTRLQEWNLEEIEKAGGTGIVLYPKDFEFFKDFIRSLT